MSVAAWALVALCVSGVVAALLGLALVVPRGLRITRRLDDISRSRFMTSLRGLQFQAERMQALNKKAQPLAERAQASIASARESAERLAMPEAVEALRKTGEDIRGLVDELS